MANPQDPKDPLIPVPPVFQPSAPMTPDEMRAGALAPLSAPLQKDLSTIPFNMQYLQGGGGGYYPGRPRYRQDLLPLPTATNPVDTLRNWANPGEYGPVKTELADRKVVIGGNTNPGEAYSATKHEYGHAVADSLAGYNEDQNGPLKPLFSPRTPPGGGFERFTKALIDSEQHRRAGYEKYYSILHETAANTSPEAFQTELFANLFQRLDFEDLPPPLRSYLAPAYKQATSGNR